jgi:hypothetical protein
MCSNSMDITSLNRLIGALPSRRHRTLLERLLGRR